MEDLHNKLIPMFKLITEKVEKKINHELQCHNVTFAQSRVLIYLYEYKKEEDYSLKELEKHFRVSQQTMAGIICRLEQKQLLVSYSDKEDKRVKRIYLTEEGLHLVQEISCKMQENERKLEQVLDENEKEQMLHILQKIYSQIGE